MKYTINVGTGRFTGEKPNFTHTETLEFTACLQNADETPFDLTGYSAQCAMKINFIHGSGEQLIAYAGGDNAAIAEPESGEIVFRVVCRSTGFYKAVRFGARECNFEISLIPAGQTESFQIAFDSVRLFPRVQVDEGEPQQAGPEYPTFAQVNSLLDQREFAPGEGNPGDVLTKTANGQGWAARERLVPISATAFSPESGVYYSQIAASGDIDFTFTFTAGNPCTFEFWITRAASGAWHFATASGIECWWEKDGVFAPENPPPDMTSTGIVYQLTFRWDGENLLGNLAYSKAVTE